MSKRTTVTIAICTWNRASLLDQTLDRLRDLHVPSGLAWEIVVVNNRCTDKTDRVLAKYSGQLPIRRVFEEKQGLSHARNAAILAARGELILWTDDDVLVDPQWLAEIVAASRANPEISFFGGPIEPWFEVEPPDWLWANWRQFSSAYAIRDFGPLPLDFDASRLPFGANYAIRRQVQREFLYDTRLGRKCTGTIGGEETQVLRRLLAAGHRGLWVPTAKVQHFLPEERLTLEYVQAFYRGVGQTEMIQRFSVDSSSMPHRLANLARHGQALAAEAWLRLVQVVPAPRGKTWAKALIRSQQRRGRLAA